LVAAAIFGQTGNIPLSALGTDTYQGFEGGLYAEGLNTPPVAYAAAALAASGEVVPRNVDGLEDPEGKILFLSIGMSNASQEFKMFERQADALPDVNPSVVLVNSAQAEESAGDIAQPSAEYWSHVDDRVAAVGSAEQVQVCWIREQIYSTEPSVFPDHAEELAGYLATIAAILKGRFPNLQLCYLSNGTYGDYVANSPAPTEPEYYESGFGEKWAIERRIELFEQGEDDGIPFLLWGPDLWADGPVPRAGDGLVWLPEDFEPDGQHPSLSGEAKVAQQLGRFFLNEPTAAWFTAPSPWQRQIVDVESDAFILDAEPTENFGGESLLYFSDGAFDSQSYLRFDLRGLQESILFAKLSVLTARSLTTAGLDLVDDSSWLEDEITYANAPPLTAEVSAGALWSGNASMAYDVTAEVLADADGILTFAFTPSISGSVDAALSREGGAGARLVLTLLREDSGVLLVEPR